MHPLEGEASQVYQPLSLLIQQPASLPALANHNHLASPAMQTPPLAVRHHRRHHSDRPCLPLTYVNIAYSARAFPDALASTISSFVTHKRRTLPLACVQGNLQLLKRVVEYERLNMYLLYRSHVLSQALVHALKYDNAIEMLECLSSNCLTGSAGKGVAEAAFLDKIRAGRKLVLSVKPPPTAIPKLFGDSMRIDSSILQEAFHGTTFLRLL